MIKQRFILSQVVWAKIKGYSWWPAMIQKYFKKSNEYSLIFYGNNPFFSRLGEENIKDYEEHYQEFSCKKTSGLKTAIEEANKDVRELNESNTNKISQSQIRFNSYLENNMIDNKYTEDYDEAMITSILSNFSLDRNYNNEYNNFRDNKDYDDNNDVNNNDKDYNENKSINDYYRDNFEICNNNIKCDSNLEVSKSTIKEEKEEEESFILSKLKQDDENNLLNDSDSAEEFYFNDKELNKVEYKDHSEYKDIKDIKDYKESFDKSIVKDDTNEETILKSANTNSVYDEDTSKLDDISFMLNFIVIQIRSNLSSNKELINKFKVELLMILKQLIYFKEKDNKLLYNVNTYFKTNIGI